MKKQIIIAIICVVIGITVGYFIYLSVKNGRFVGDPKTDPIIENYLAFGGFKCYLDIIL